jgi:hypothetical protein
MVKAKIKASPIRETPKQVKKRTSRKSPSNLDKTVSPLTIEIFLLIPAILE